MMVAGNENGGNDVNGDNANCDFLLHSKHFIPKLIG
jgi:hypothetical protein